MIIRYQEIILQVIEVHEETRVVRTDKPLEKPKKQKPKEPPSDRHRESNRKWAAKEYADPEKRAKLLKYQSEWRKANRDKVNAMVRRKRDRDRLRDLRAGESQGDSTGPQAARSSGSSMEEIRRPAGEVVSNGRTDSTTAKEGK